MSKRQNQTASTSSTDFVATMGLPIPSVVAPLPSLRQMALPQNFGSIAGVKKTLITVPVRKPGPQAYVRVRPGEEFRMAAAILQLKEDGECYLVLPSAYEDLAQEIRPKMLYTGINRDGSPFIWPVNVPGEDGRLDAWSESAHVAAEMAEDHWVRLVANRTVGAYDVMEATNLAESPKWPEQTFEQLLQLAFKGRFIDSVEHPIVKRLRGEI